VKEKQIPITPFYDLVNGPLDLVVPRSCVKFE